MSGAAGLGVILGGLALLSAAFGQGEIAGFPVNDVTAVLAFAAVVLLVTGRTAETARHGAGATLAAIALWSISIAGLAALYGNRDALSDAARSLADGSGLLEPEAVVGQGGEVTITRRGGGSFIVPGRINDREARFVFDTGASTMVLTHGAALAAGLKPDKLNYRVPVGTANGNALAAPVTLDRVSIGSITLHRVPALVARPGMLGENLLGMTFLERLASYEVRGNRLVLRAVRS
ncbi:MAG TPA: TIGR02281 family clan AA aspartic protease [Enterovirga sp.]